MNQPPEWVELTLSFERINKKLDKLIFLATIINNKLKNEEKNVPPAIITAKNS
jgi:hypothetical protein